MISIFLDVDNSKLEYGLRKPHCCREVIFLSENFENDTFLKKNSDKKITF